MIRILVDSGLWARMRMPTLSRSAGPDEIGVPERMPGCPRAGAPPIGCAEGGGRYRTRSRRWPSREAGSRPTGCTGTSGGETAFPATVGSGRIGNTAKMPIKETGAMAVLKRLVEGWLGAVVIRRGRVARTAAVAERAAGGRKASRLAAIQAVLESAKG